MILYLEIEFARRPDAPYFDIGRFVGADRNRFVRQIGNGQHESGKLRLYFRQGRFIGFQFVAESADFGHDGGSVFFFAFQDADLFGKRIAPGLHFFSLCLKLAALRFKRVESCHVKFEFAGFKLCCDSVDILAKELNVDHGMNCNDKRSIVAICRFFGKIKSCCHPSGGTNTEF